MFLAIHVPMFGSANIDSKPIFCPYCPSGTNDWEEAPIETCSPGDLFVCNRCRKSVIINWGLEEPDHLSKWLNSEMCYHRLCKLKYQELKEQKGWTDGDGNIPGSGHRDQNSG